MYLIFQIFLCYAIYVREESMTTETRGKQKTLHAVPSGGARGARRREARQGALKEEKNFFRPFFSRQRLEIFQEVLYNVSW